MSYLKKEQIDELMVRYGVPRTLQASYEISPPEFNMLRLSRKAERSHDVTLFIFRDESRREFVGISKPMFPAGIFRAPSGAVHPGEDFVVGALREGREETGLEMELEEFILIIEVVFTCDGDSEPWTSYIFTALSKGGELEPEDVQEIKEARWITFEELLGPIRSTMLGTGAGLFRYRVFLHDAAYEAIHALGGTAGGEDRTGDGRGALGLDLESELLGEHG
jgi:ADP-ribose pyrophosphatase YjhB (NUDIX family)